MRASGSLIAVYDQESGSVGDAVEFNEQVDDIIFCPAIPTCDAWLFADADALTGVLGSRGEEIINRMPLPEQIPYPKALRYALLRNKSDLSKVAAAINIRSATSRSPSLKYFIQSALRLTGLSGDYLEGRSATEGLLDRSILVNLISEVYPSNSTIFRSASGEVVSAKSMMQEISNGTELGREYGSEILRVARDLLARQARRKKDSGPSK